MAANSNPENQREFRCVHCDGINLIPSDQPPATVGTFAPASLPPMPFQPSLVRPAAVVPELEQSETPVPIPLPAPAPKQSEERPITQRETTVIPRPAPTTVLHTAPSSANRKRSRPGLILLRLFTVLLLLAGIAAVFPLKEVREAIEAIYPAASSWWSPPK